MNTQFKYEYNRTMKFEECYEEELRICPEERKDIIKSGLVVYLQGSCGLIGECYGATPFQLEFIDECPEDCTPEDDESVYVYSTTILPMYQGQGYGKALIEEFARHTSNQGYVKLVGHTTTPAMKHMREKQGAIFRPGAVHENWYGTTRTAHFYTQFLTQDKDYNCGPMAMAYLLESRGYTYLVEDLEERLGTTEEDGTDPDRIFQFLKELNIKSNIIRTLQPNSIIDIFDVDDGHWIVLIEKTRNDLWRVYDSLQGIIEVDEAHLTDNWYSPRYGKKRGFQIL